MLGHSSRTRSHRSWTWRRSSPPPRNRPWPGRFPRPRSGSWRATPMSSTPWMRRRRAPCVEPWTTRSRAAPRRSPERCGSPRSGSIPTGFPSGGRSGRSVDGATIPSSPTSSGSPGGSPTRHRVEVDNPFNRVWIQLSNGADRLDGVLNEFGFTPSNHPDVGGAHFGLQPQTIEELDPSGTLVRLWNRFVKLHARYRELERAAGAATTSEANEEALRRWRAAAEE